MSGLQNVRVNYMNIDAMALGIYNVEPQKDILFAIQSEKNRTAAYSASAGYG